MWFGLVLIIIGLVLLLENLGILSPNAWNVIWPILVVLWGISILVKAWKR